ncbi:hypothetical protein Q3G72_019890 [Acer saccharum]|nr:hypothetical protein Q3G72_019890 [Acer saccharum]
MNQGTQWMALMLALALLPGVPPAFRLTEIGPVPDNTNHSQEVGSKLAEFAATFQVKFEFEYRWYEANSLADLDWSELELGPSEFDSIAINSVLELHKLLARPGAVEKVLSVVNNLRPDIFMVVKLTRAGGQP